ncbi:DNA methylase N-4 [Christiangramia fulva]|uniref:DNA methylase N-4 n=2 Tax=Christiangramia fulva TaxID=2126553 RepID=A0A2R3ZBD7_9FLAO|nr:DNA methylase N-4 [Christiangramia fulva]
MDGEGIYLTNYVSIRDGKLDPTVFNVASLDEASVLRGLGSTKTFREFMKIFTGDAGPLGRRNSEMDGEGIYLTNYVSIRDGKLDPTVFNVASLDEASVLRGLGSTKTFREFMKIFTGDAGPLGNRRGAESVKYRFVATATPSPNDYIELLAYADFLGVMDVSQAKTRFFKRDSTKADKLTIHAHKEEEFWLWVASWAIFVNKPSDITGNPEDDKDYILPPLQVNWHEIPTDHSKAGIEKDGTFRMFKNAAFSLAEAAREKRESLDSRIQKLLELREENPGSHRIIWHDLEAERKAIKKAIPESVSVYGSQKLEDREESIRAFSDGEIQELSTKPVIAGSGCNLQRYCSWAIYLGIGYKFNDWIQSVHRLQRFGQPDPNGVRIDLIYTEAERKIRKDLERKWRQHKKMIQKMTEIIKKYGLSHQDMAKVLERKMGVERIEVKGKRYTMVNNDNVDELPRLKSNSVGLVHTSIPFATQYEYTPNYADYGHSENVQEFFQQMDYATPEVFRVLMPGRIAAIHVKDRIVPGGLNGLGFQTVYPFHKDCIDHFTKHGFAYMGMKTIVTDVVRENNQTYRLGWTEQCKDGTKMGVGMPEYLLLFRKPQTDSSKGYADVPVIKDKIEIAECPECFERTPFEKWEFDFDQEPEPVYYCPNCKKGNLSDKIPTKYYSRSRWQVDAHGFTRSSGNRCLKPEELAKLDHDKIFKEFKRFSLEKVYDFEHHVKIGETLDATGKLPTSFMLLQPQSWHEDVWSDITRMLTLNSSQWSKGKEMHLCPLQFDIVDRVIEQMSNPGDVVLDYFSGIGTVPYRSVLKGRIGYGIELANNYFLDGVSYCKAAEEKMEMPTLFDVLENEKVEG